MEREKWRGKSGKGKVEREKWRGCIKSMLCSKSPVCVNCVPTVRQLIIDSDCPLSVCQVTSVCRPCVYRVMGVGRLSSCCIFLSYNFILLYYHKCISLYILFY